MAVKAKEFLQFKVQVIISYRVTSSCGDCLLCQPYSKYRVYG